VHWNAKGTSRLVRDAAQAHRPQQLHCPTCGVRLEAGDLLREAPRGDNFLAWSLAARVLSAVCLADAAIRVAERLGICPICHQYLTRGCLPGCELADWRQLRA